MKRRTVMFGALSGTAALILGQSLSAQETKPKPPLPRVRQRNVKIRVSKFAFHPNHVTIPQGAKIVFELTSSDVMHSFSIPDLNTRIDVPPGQITLLPLTPEQAGDFIFICDTLCGDGHEKMKGKLTVTAST
jgi:cytochrome c oxidase subunit 2